MSDLRFRKFKVFYDNGKIISSLELERKLSHLSEYLQVILNKGAGFPDQDHQSVGTPCRMEFQLLRTARKGDSLETVLKRVDGYIKELELLCNKPSDTEPVMLVKLLFETGGIALFCFLVATEKQSLKDVVQRIIEKKEESLSLCDATFFVATGCLDFKDIESQLIMELSLDIF